MAGARCGVQRGVPAPVAPEQEGVWQEHLKQRAAEHRHLAAVGVSREHHGDVVGGGRDECLGPVAHQDAATDVGGALAERAGDGVGEERGVVVAEQPRIVEPTEKEPGPIVGLSPRAEI